MNLDQLLQYTIQNDASDLHIVAGHAPILRVRGDMIPMDVDILSAQMAEQLITSTMSDEQKSLYHDEMDIDFSLSVPNIGRFRINAFRTLQGCAAVFRTISTHVQTLSELKLPDILTNISNLHKGLVLITGPTGSGKTTTMAAMIDHINKTSRKHIITIEDPIEYVHQSHLSLVNQREVHSQTRSFQKALRSALREDPDVIMIGELRDQETISLALTAAETGHLVFGTLHTSSAAKTIDRIIDVFPEGDKPLIRTMLASSLEAVITQVLAKTADNKSRVAAHEILINNSAIRNLIRDNKIAQIFSVMQVNGKLGMTSMAQSLADLQANGLISGDETKRLLNDMASNTPNQNQEKSQKSGTNDGF